MMDFITELDVYKAVERIDRGERWNANQQPGKYWLRVADRLYPPIYVIELASNGRLSKGDVTSGPACGHLRNLGFEIVTVSPY